MQRTFLAMILAASSFPMPGCGPSEAQLEELRVTFEAASKRSSELDAAWKRGVTEAALKSILPRRGVPCQLGVSGPTEGDLMALTNHVLHAFSLAGTHTLAQSSSFDSPLFAERIVAVRHDQLSRAGSPSAASIRREVATLKSRLEKGVDRIDAPLNQARRLAGESPAWDMLVIIDEVELPEPDTLPATDAARDQKGTFTKGFANGRAYVYDYAANRIRCFATITVESSDQVKALQWSSDKENSRFVRSQLEKDLWQQMLVAPSGRLESVATTVIVRDPQESYFYD